MAYYNSHASVLNVNWGKKFLIGFSALAIAATGVLSLAKGVHATSTMMTCDEFRTAANTNTLVTGSTYELSGTCSQTTDINKSVTVTGDVVAGVDGYTFQTVADGVTFDGVTFTAASSVTSQNFISVLSNGATIKNSSFTGNITASGYGFDVTYSKTGLVATNNTFSNLLVGAYVNSSPAAPTTGTFTNNTFNNVQIGIVAIAHADLMLTGNTFTNVSDTAIAFINDSPPITSADNKYTCAELQAISAANGHAKVTDEFVSGCVMPTAAKPTTKEVCKNNGYKLFVNTDGTQRFKNQGACVSYVQASNNASFKRQ